MDAYLILGTRNSKRRAILCDLISRGLGAESRAAVFISENENPSEFDAPLSSLALVSRYGENRIECARAVSGKSDAAFFVADASKNIADEIEAFKEICDAGIFKLIRIIGVFDCSLYGAAFDECAPFFDAMSHFCDAVLLSNRGGVSGKVVNEIKKRYKDECRPHTFQLAMKNGEVENPCMILIDETRRISMAFDEYDPLDELELDEDTLPDEPFTVEKKADVYLEKLDNGLRRKPILNGDELIARYKNAK